MDFMFARLWIASAKTSQGRSEKCHCEKTFRLSWQSTIQHK
ncbi:hypothetical protein [Helicobacter sp.]|nr:hypothetical protein [Helicobacter sp.]